MTGESNQTVVTDDDHGAILAIVTWCLGCILIFATALRIGTRFLTKNGPYVDDLCVIIAVAIAIGGMVVVSFAVQSGLGKRYSQLSADRRDEIQKECYIVTILYVLSVGISKLSVMAFLDRLACTRLQRLCVTVLSILVLLWTISVTLVVVFACGLPQPWGFYQNHCIEVLPFWFSASAIDVSTDVIMILLPIQIVAGLDIKTKKKLIVMAIFTLRLFLMGLSVIRVVLMRAYLPEGADLSFDSIPFHTITQAHAALSITLACGPAFKPFLHNIRTSMLSSRLARRRTQSSFGHDSYVSKSLVDGTQGSKTTKSLRRYSPVDWHFVSNDNHSSPTRAEPAPLANGYHSCALLHERHTLSTLRTSEGSFSNDMKSAPPIRPPPPPDELRPDLSIFGPRILPGCTDPEMHASKTENDLESRKIYEGQSRDKEMARRPVDHEYSRKRKEHA
ncbi:unnamed protein product [Periconia digitata]|uniref:Rhodopsin domain-containing protein n=1 Tax=Periconia digitata TaxID=1303443 RepID=A0A9W4URD6_9PLEO|nr:unnamed protein product [Periconia digitata]